MVGLGGEREARGGLPLKRDSRHVGRAFFSLGNLRNTSNAGAFIVNARNSLSTANWNYGSRQSGLFKNIAATTARHSGGAAACLAQLSEICLKTTGPVSVADRSDDTQRDGMKTYCKNFVIDEAHVRAAYVLWMQSGAGRKNMHRIFAEHGSPSELIREITQEIRDRTLALRPIRRYPRYEPSNGKTRLIGIASVKQQICDYVAVLALEQFLAAKVGHYQVASVKGKGQLFAARTIKKWVNDGGYWVHLDIRKCYPSIKTDLVMSMIEKYVRSEDVRYVVRAIFSKYDGCLEIGSYLSLRLAQMVLSFGYHHVEGLGKERRAKRRPLISHQLWYMDDILLMSQDKRDLKAAIRSLAGFMAGMGLEVKPWKVCRVGDDEPIDMAGFVMRPDRVTVRDTIFLRASRACRQFDRRPTLAGARRVCSYWGWFKHTDSRGFMANSNIQEINTRARRLVAAAERMSA